jgi:F-type H+-transporting ATPase subunit delta
MSASKIARRYARALSELCDEAQTHSVVGKQLEGFASLYGANAELQNALKNPTVALDEKRRVLQALFQKAGVDTTTQNFMFVLLDHGRIDCIGDVARAFRDIVDIASRRVRASVTSAVPMSSTDVDRVQAALGRLTGKTVTLDARVDADLIGGAQVQIGNLVLDSSIRSHLEKLRDRLVH